MNLSRSLEIFCKSSGLVNGPSFREQKQKALLDFLEKLQLFEFIDRAFCQALDSDKRPKKAKIDGSLFFNHNRPI